MRLDSSRGGRNLSVRGRLGIFGMEAPRTGRFLPWFPRRDFHSSTFQADKSPYLKLGVKIGVFSYNMLSSYTKIKGARCG